MIHYIKYRGYSIYCDRDCTPLKLDWNFVHDDYDGAPDANDFRCGREKTIEDCIITINEIEADNA